MKLENKKTGEIGTLIVDGAHNFVTNFAVEDDERNRLGKYNSLAELNAEWEDYEELKEYWFINDLDGEPMKCELRYCPVRDFADWSEKRKQMGNYFETKEEAEKAVEKLKAWKRLKDKGFDFVGCFKDNTINYEFVERPLDYDEAEEAEQDLAFLFGGEE